MPRPFEHGDRNYLDDLNDLFNTGVPRVREDPTDLESAPTTVDAAGRQVVFDDNGCVADVTATCTVTFNVSTVADGWGMFFHVLTGTCTLNVGSSGHTFADGNSSKTVTAGNAAFISNDGDKFRIFRMSAT